MILTDEKIMVTEQMMFDAGLSMLFGASLGVPQDNEPKTGSGWKKNVVWKGMMELTEEDFDKIENFFLANPQLTK